MSFAPVLPMGGYAGWKFLTRTMDTQRAAFSRDPAAERDRAWFRETIGKVKTAEELVADPRLLRVALTAYGLEADVGAKAFIRKVLGDGTLTPGALVNKLADKRYLEFSRAFGFGDFATPRNQISGFADKILGLWDTRRFESAVGQANGDMRLALNARRELATIIERGGSENTKWFSIMGSPPLRRVFEAAFALPTGFGLVDIDRQLGTFTESAQRMFGSSDPTTFSDPAQMEKLVRNFLLRADAAMGSAGSRPTSAALTLLSNAAASNRAGLLLRL